MNIGRALLAAALHILVVLVVTTNFLPFVASALDVTNHDASPEAIRATIVPMSSVLIGLVVAFIAGWWGFSGAKQRWLPQGLLIGALIALFWTVLALGYGRLEALSPFTVAYVPGALLGAAVASRGNALRRAFLAAGIHGITSVAIWTIISLLALAWLAEAGGGLSDSDVARYQANALWVGVVLRTSVAFLAGWWGARGVLDNPIKQGVTIGLLILGLTWLWTLVLARPISLVDVLLLSPEIAAATAGAVFERTRREIRQERSTT